MARQKVTKPSPKTVLKRKQVGEAGNGLKVATLPLQKRWTRSMSRSQAVVSHDYSSATVKIEEPSAVAVVPHHSCSSPPPHEWESISSERMATLIEALERLVRTGLLAWRAKVDLENLVRENAHATVMPSEIAEAQQEVTNTETVDWYQWIEVLDMFAELQPLDPYSMPFAPYMADPFNPSMSRSCSSHPIMISSPQLPFAPRPRSTFHVETYQLLD